MKENNASETPHRPAKRRLLGPGLLLLIGVLVLVALFVIWRVQMSNRVQKTLADIRAAGFPTNLAQLEQQYYPKLPSDRNSATFFQSAFNLIHVSNNEKILPDFQSEKTASFFSPTNLSKIDQLLASNHDTLEILRQTPPATNCRYPINLSLGGNTLLPHLNPLRDSSRLLAFDAVMRARKGDMPEAIDDLNALFRLCHSLDNEPFLICQFERMNIETLIVTSLGHVLNSAQLTDAQLVQLSQAFRDVARSTGMDRAMAADLCVGIDTFQSVEKTRGSEYAVAYLFKFSGLYNRDYDLFLRTMSENLELTSTPFPAKLDAATAIDRRVSQATSNRVYILSHGLLPAAASVSVKECAVIARLNLIQTVLAIERFRLANQNRLPEKLSELAPSFLPSVPMDPFDGKSLRYKKLPKGYMVYSVGEDRKDDGGAFGLGKGPDGGPSDITFAVECDH